MVKIAVTSIFQSILRKPKHMWKHIEQNAFQLLNIFKKQRNEIF